MSADAIIPWLSSAAVGAITGIVTTHLLTKERKPAHSCPPRLLSQPEVEYLSEKLPDWYVETDPRLYHAWLPGESFPDMVIAACRYQPYKKWSPVIMVPTLDSDGGLDLAAFVTSCQSAAEEKRRQEASAHV